MRTFKIFTITTAYEQGVGKGHQAFERKEEIVNPYAALSDEHEAWQLGYLEGKLQASRAKPWQSLTTEEIAATGCETFLARGFEAKLREKNGFK